MGAIASFRNFVPRDTPSAHLDSVGSVPRHGIVRRIFHAIVDAHERKANREVERYLGLSGGKLTDELERRLTERLTQNRNFRL